MKFIIFTCAFAFAALCFSGCASSGRNQYAGELTPMGGVSDLNEGGSAPLVQGDSPLRDYREILASPGPH